MTCRVCHMTQPGPHGIGCRIEARELAHKMILEELLDQSTPWGEAPTRGAMLARMDAFLVRYAEACHNPEKAERVRALAHPKLLGMYS